jgi:UDP-N-acetylglucosamine acyltransferase
VPDVHPTAVVEPGAELAEEVCVRAGSYIGPHVELGAGCVVGPHAVVTGRTRVGPRTRIFPFACVGEAPQDKSYREEPTRLSIGADNVIREHVTIHVGTQKGGGLTQIGDDNLIMNGVHVAHDCRIASHTILASFTGLAGHVAVEDYAVLGAYVGVHQFCRVGESVMAAAGAMLSLDAPPFSMVAGDRAHLAGLNSVGLRRRDFPAETLAALKRAFRLIFGSRLRFEEAAQRVREEAGQAPEVERLLVFLEKSERGFCR